MIKFTSSSSLKNNGINCPSLKTDIQSSLTNYMVNDKRPHNTNCVTSKMTSSIIIFFLDLIQDNYVREVYQQIISQIICDLIMSNNLTIAHYISTVLYTFQSIFTSIIIFYLKNFTYVVFTYLNSF